MNIINEFFKDELCQIIGVKNDNPIVTRIAYNIIHDQHPDANKNAETMTNYIIERTMKSLIDENLYSEENNSEELDKIKKEQKDFCSIDRDDDEAYKDVVESVLKRNIEISEELNQLKAIGLMNLTKCGLLDSERSEMQVRGGPTLFLKKFGNIFGQFRKVNVEIKETEFIEEDGPYFVIMSRGLVHVYPMHLNSFAFANNLNIMTNGMDHVYVVEDKVVYGL